MVVSWIYVVVRCICRWFDLYVVSIIDYFDVGDWWSVNLSVNVWSGLWISFCVCWFDWVIEFNGVWSCVCGGWSYVWC